MAVPLALPLAPVIVSSGPATTAAAATFVIGSTLHLADTLYGFRRSAPTLPPLTGLEGLATLQEMVEDFLAGARVPVGFPLPPPWRPEATAVGLAATSLGLWDKLTNGLAQLWGALNSRPEATSDLLPVPGISASGDQAPAGNTTPGTLTITVPPFSSAHLAGCVGPLVISTHAGGTYTATNVIEWSVEVVSDTGCGIKALNVRRKRLNQTDSVLSVVTFNRPGGVGAQTIFAALDFAWTGPGASPWAWPQEALALPDGYVTPEAKVESSPDVATLLQPLPYPANVPEVEAPEVLPAVAPVEPGPEPQASPIVIPGPVPLPLPVADPSGVTVQNGSVLAAAPLPVPVTDPTSIIPWPGAAPIPGTGTAPAPTLEGIAQEVGRIERKIEMMMSPTAPGNLRDLIGPIVEAILAFTSGTVYTLDSPCEVDAEGNKLPPVEVQAPGALTQFGAILNRVDALAELLQVHKDLKQPNCRGADVPVGGEFVTVNFEQID
jgi:hypothetical protein